MPTPDGGESAGGDHYGTLGVEQHPTGSAAGEVAGGDAQGALAVPASEKGVYRDIVVVACQDQLDKKTPEWFKQVCAGRRGWHKGCMSLPGGFRSNKGCWGCVGHQGCVIRAWGGKRGTHEHVPHCQASGLKGPYPRPRAEGYFRLWWHDLL